jgi:hypothetical protein
MSDSCTHLDTIEDVSPSSEGCEDCLKPSQEWWYCYVDDVLFEMDSDEPSPSHQ